jgi:2-oxoisovalerate dehydrogenase E2 component (dihydrolipoyl transacylase)
MARTIVKMPDIGEGTTEAEIVAWLVKPGDNVDEDDPLAEVMTDKATVEIPSPVAGTIVTLHGKVGEKMPVGSELIVLETERAPAAARASHHPAISAVAHATPLPQRPPRTIEPEEVPQPAPHPPTPDGVDPSLSRNAGEGQEAPAQKPLSRIAGEGADGRSPEAGEGAATAPTFVVTKPLASPAVRKRAWDLGIALQFVAGSGPGGRITQADLDAFIAAGRRPTASTTAPTLAQRDGVEEIPITGLRRVIAERLQQSKRRIPHYSYVEEVDVTALEELRDHLNARHGDRTHLTLLPFLMRAIVNAVVEHPQVNSRFDDEAGIVHRHRAVHLGVATQTEAGLMVPVVHHAEALDLWQAAAEVQRLAEAARAAKATREELTGSTITITSLGRLGGLAATPVINYPEVAIVGVNRIDKRPVVRDGAVVIRKMMNLSSSFDHRIVDGWEAASFIQRVKEYLEHPATLFIG